MEVLPMEKAGVVVDSFGVAISTPHLSGTTNRPKSGRFMAHFESVKTRHAVDVPDDAWKCKV